MKLWGKKSYYIVINYKNKTIRRVKLFKKQIAVVGTGLKLQTPVNQ